MDVISQIEDSVTTAITKLWPDFGVPALSMTTPNNPEFGDYSTGVALGIAKQLKRNPLEVAEELKSSINKPQTVSEITVTAPGFVNFVLDYKGLARETLAERIKPDELKVGNVSIEHTSVNPNKAAHIGHLRNACLGDSLGRIFRHLGNKVEIQNYIDDLGLQVADSVVAFETFGDAPDDIEIDKWLWKIYADINKKYEAHPELRERRETLLHEMERDESETAKAIVARIVPAQIKTFERFGINYDLLVYEHDIVRNHLWDTLFEELKTKGLIHKPEEGPHVGAWVVKFGESEREDKILVRSNGVLTYTAKDLAYALWKFGKGAEMPEYANRLLPIDQHINLIDERQSYPQAVIKHVMAELGYNKESEQYNHLGYGTVKLSANAMKQLGIETDPEEEKAAYAMSGRSGIGVMIDDLFEAVVSKQLADHPETDRDAAAKIAIGSIRYYMLKTRPDREIVFDFDDALRTDGNTGIYVQYAYARANNILDKLEAASFNNDEANFEINNQEKRLLKTMSEAHGIIQSAVTKLDPSLVCDYIFDLANAFAKFYETSPVLKAETPTLRSFRTALVARYRDLLGEMMDLVGVPKLAKI